MNSMMLDMRLSKLCCGTLHLVRYRLALMLSWTLVVGFVGSEMIFAHERKPSAQISRFTLPMLQKKCFCSGW